jgi:hypothetical protein
MKKLFRSAVSLLLMTMCATAMYLWPPTPSVTASNLKPVQEIGQGRKTETLKGDAAKLRVLQLRAKNKAFNRAMKDMERLGKKPNWDLSTIILHGEHAIAAAKEGIVPAESPTIHRASYTPPQDDFYGNEGELTFVTYDGPEHTWDGTVYGYDYSTGQTEVYDGAIYDNYTEDQVNWDVTDEVYYPPDGGDPYRSEPCYRAGYCLQQAIAKAAPQNNTPQVTGTFTKASLRNASGVPAATGRPAHPVLNFFKRFFNCFIRAFPKKVGACPPTGRFLGCLLRSAGSSTVCCGGAAYNNIGSPTGSGGYCY